MPQQYEDTSQVHEANEVGECVLVSGSYPPVILQPGVEPLNLPASFVSSEFASVLSLWSHPASAVWRDEINALCFELSV
jgi:hypothetical protein